MGCTFIHTGSIICISHYYDPVQFHEKETAITTAGAFSLPTADAFAGIENYINAIASKGFLQSLCYSLLITITSVIAILVCCSMCAWYITRVKGPVSKMLYFLFVFSMVVPFQMVMFTLSQTADSLKLNTPWNIWIIYLGFGAGLAVFMFAGFMKSIPLEIEEASMIDGCNPIQTFFLIVLPILKPTLVSVGILEAMWVWNDYLLPTLVLDIKKYKTIPMLIQYFRGSYGKVEMGPMNGKYYADSYSNRDRIPARTKTYYQRSSCRSS